MYLCLDLSLKCTGWAIFYEDGVIESWGRIVPPSNLSNPFKIHFIATRLKQKFFNVSNLIIEDLYLGYNFRGIKELARLAGAVENLWVEFSYKEPVFYMASTARKTIGISGRAHKSEVQLFVINNYLKHRLSVGNSTLSYLNQRYLLLKSDNSLTKSQLKYRLDKLSALIDKATGIGEDIADAIVLGKAFVRRRNG